MIFTILKHTRPLWSKLLWYKGIEEHGGMCWNHSYYYLLNHYMVLIKKQELFIQLWCTDAGWSCLESFKLDFRADMGRSSKDKRDIYYRLAKVHMSRSRKNNQLKEFSSRRRDGEPGVLSNFCKSTTSLTFFEELRGLLISVLLLEAGAR